MSKGTFLILPRVITPVLQNETEQREVARTKPSLVRLGSEPRTFDSLYHGSVSRSRCFSFKYQLTGHCKVQLLSQNAVSVSLDKPRSLCPTARKSNQLICSYACCTSSFKRKDLWCKAFWQMLEREKKNLGKIPMIQADSQFLMIQRRAFLMALKKILCGKSLTIWSSKEVAHT